MKVYVIAFDDDSPGDVFATQEAAEAHILDEARTAYERYVQGHGGAATYAALWVDAGGALKEELRPLKSFDDWLIEHRMYYGYVAECEFHGVLMARSPLLPRRTRGRSVRARSWR